MSRGRAWIFNGGWPGHRPHEVGAILAEELRGEGFVVEAFDRLDVLRDAQRLALVDLLIPNWTMGEIGDAELEACVQAVRAGTGVAGLHGGMGDAFRCRPAFQWVVGGQFMAHPGGEIPYSVHIVDPSHPLTRAMEDFTVVTEQYYMLVDPANHVLATTRFDDVVMPVAWTKTHDRGRVFYCSLGHSPEIAGQEPIRTLMRRGMLYAARREEEKG